MEKGGDNNFRKTEAGSLDDLPLLLILKLVRGEVAMKKRFGFIEINWIGEIAGLLLGIALLFSPALRAADAAGPQAEADLSQASIGTAKVVDLSALPQVSVSAPEMALPAPRPRGGVSEAEYQQRKAAAARSAMGQPLEMPGPPPDGGETGKETPGATTIFLGQSQGRVPADMALAVSSRWVVQVVNSSIAVYDKAGVVQAGFPKALGGASGFFSSASTDIGDPRAFYDQSRNRFVVVADDFTRGRMWLAASTSADPRGTWNVYSFAPWGTASCRDSTKSCPDFPMIGFDDQTIYLSLNFFPSTGGVSNWVLLLPKANIYAGAGFSYNFWLNLTWGGVRIDTLQPVSLLTPGEHPRAGFAVASFNINFGGGQCSSLAGCNGMMVWAFSNNLVQAGSPGPELTAVAIPTATTYHFPANANQPGFPFSVETNDVRISGSPVFHAGLLSASLNTNGPDGHPHTLWFQIRPFLNNNNDAKCTGAFLNKCPQITGAQFVNEDCYFCGGQGAAGGTYYGTLAPDNGGDLTMVFNYSDNDFYPGTAYVSRRATQAQNTMHDAGIFMCTGGSANLSGRWGDYTAAVGDISIATTNTFWFSGMHAASSPAGTWRTCIGKNGFTTNVAVP